MVAVQVLSARPGMTCVSLVLMQIREVWNTYELDLVNYQNKCRLIRGWDDLFNKVKEHINSVSAMKLSPYYKVPCGGRPLPSELPRPGPAVPRRAGQVAGGPCAEAACLPRAEVGG